LTSSSSSSRLKQGDRFFYEYRSAGFQPEQLRELRKASMARLMCDNLELANALQPKALQMPSADDNRVVDCAELPRPDLGVFRGGSLVETNV
jgi:hypothetical protein